MLTTSATTTAIEKAEVTLSFVTQTKAGQKGHANPSCARIFYSTDFDGDYSETGVNKATWTELSDRFDLPTDTEQAVRQGRFISTISFRKTVRRSG